MKTEPDKGPPLKQYLLGELGSEDQQQLEQRLMIETRVFEELQRLAINSNLTIILVDWRVQASLCAGLGRSWT